MAQTRKTLVMWSGGVDSTYGLARLLNETEDQVFAHHIHRHARHDSGVKEALTCENEAEAIAIMRPYIAETYRSFRYSESAVDLTDFSHFARDTSTSMFFAAHATRSFGFTSGDRILLSMNADEDREWNPGSEIYGFLRSVTVRLLKTVWRSEDVPYAFVWDPPPTKMTEVNYLPLELFEMTASCRNPSRITDGVFDRCGRCAECITLSSFSHKDDLRRCV